MNRNECWEITRNGKLVMTYYRRDSAIAMAKMIAAHDRSRDEIQVWEYSRGLPPVRVWTRPER